MKKGFNICIDNQVVCNLNFEFDLLSMRAFIALCVMKSYVCDLTDRNPCSSATAVLLVPDSVLDSNESVNRHQTRSPVRKEDQHVHRVHCKLT